MTEVNIVFYCRFILIFSPRLLVLWIEFIVDCFIGIWILIIQISKC